jgi:hypothetical protein
MVAIAAMSLPRHLPASSSGGFTVSSVAIGSIR